MKTAEKLQLCVGCHNDFYNDKNPLGVKRCWSFASARVVRRFRIGWWVNPDSADRFTKVRTLSCHSAPGKYADFEELPDHLVQLARGKRRAERTEPAAP